MRGGEIFGVCFGDCWCILLTYFHSFAIFRRFGALSFVIGVIVVLWVFGGLK